jgi:hypothetical protein
VVAIAADEVSELAALQTKLSQIVLLSDLTLQASQAWGAHYPGAEEPTPTTFVVAGNQIRWRRVERQGSDWPTYVELVAALDAR